MTPEAQVADSVTVGLAAVGIWRLIRYIANAPCRPDPWPAALEEEMNREDATQLCHRCLVPQPQTQHFCENCGASIGKYNNVMMPQAYYSMGEISISGVCSRLVHPKAGLILGYILLPICTGLWPLAPFYWTRFYLNLARSRQESEAPGQ